ncbi:hypothetical protein PInf_019065 [Phytophthora infestans]|nr:hypothetical protein PInf_019065 [Phytophthora infestans]
MGDSAAALWDSELLRARQWLAATRRDKQQERDLLFQRVKAHIGFKDHQLSLQSEVTASEDEDDGALDFLGDVDAADMSALLQAEAAKAATFVSPVDTVSGAGDIMKPLEMPNNLVSPKLKPKTKAVPMSQLDPKALATSTTASVTASATLGSDSTVNALMQELHVQVLQSDTEETKTEESTPPHLLKNFGRNNKPGSNGIQVQVGKDKYMQHVSSKSPQDPHKKKVAAAPATAARKPEDDVTAEMLSWVTGYRDPEVIRRKENMRRKRKNTHRYGVTSEEEQRQVLLQVKTITRESDSESESDMSSDYSPAEDEEIPEPDEPDVVDLLSDDYLDSDEDKQPAKRKRKRLRQAETATKKKKTHSRKPAVTRKVTQKSSKPSPVDVLEARPLSSPAESERGHVLAATETALIEDSDDGKSNHPIELLSGGDETGDSGKSSIPLAIGEHTKSNHGARESTILRLKIFKNFKSPQDRVLEEAHQVNDPVHAGSTATGTADKSADGSISLGLVSSEAVDVGRPRESDARYDSTRITDTAEHISGYNDDDSDPSDTGTVDFEGEDLSVEIEKDVYREDNTATEVMADSSADVEPEGPEAITGEEQKKAAKAPAEAQSRAGPEDDDISEAETEILDDDEPDTDDLGLDYSDDSDSGDKPVSNEKKKTGAQNGATRNMASKGKSSSESSGDSDLKRNAATEDKNAKIDASRAGVQQFFDFTPLKLKPKTKSTTSTAPKPLPVHTYAETHSKKGGPDAKKATDDQKKPSDMATKSTAGSNGLRPTSFKTPVATTTTMKGKYAVTRRSTKLLNPEDAPGAKRLPKSQFTMVPTKGPNNNVAQDLDDVPLTILAKEMANKSEDKPQARYLSYAGAKKIEDAPTYAAETPRIAPKSRFGGGGLNSSSSATQIFLKEQHSQGNGKGGYRREPQISIYDALHVDGQESVSDIRDGASYKRPSRFKKMQEEAARNGTPMVKSRLQDTDWDKVPIPKKKKQAPQVDKSTPDATTSKTSSNDSKHAGKAHNKRRKKNSGSAKKTSGSSYYGPQDDVAESTAAIDAMMVVGESDHRHLILETVIATTGVTIVGVEGHLAPGLALPVLEVGITAVGIAAVHARGLGHERNRLNVIITDLRDSSKKKEATDRAELDEVCQNGKIGDTDRPAKKQKTSHSTESSPLPGALTSFDDDGDNMFISDSDDDGNAMLKEAEDIRFDLDSISADEALMARQVYVTGVNPTVVAEQIGEDFARFGVAVDRETGFPAIDIFSCQRTHLGRGDACVTFDTERGALEAVEELNSKNVKNSMIRVRRMDVRTQRILTVQFQTARDTWKCTGTKCRADVSIWNAKCDKCGRTRVYGPSNIKIGAESWLCSLCFTANDSFAASCHGCKESLPEVDRSTFYMS